MTLNYGSISYGSVIYGFNNALTQVCDALFFPFTFLTDTLALALLSAIAGLFFLLLYGQVSSQSKLREVKKQIVACLLEALLYRHNLGALLKAQRRLFATSFRYIALAVPPFVILLLPGVLMLSQLYLRFQWQPLEIGEEVVVEITLKDSFDLRQAKLTPSMGLQVAAPPVRVAKEKKIYWKLTPTWESESLYADFSLSLEDDATRIPINSRRYLSNTFAHSVNSWWEALIFPGGPPLFKQQDLESIYVRYPAKELQFASFSLNWVIVFLFISLASGLVFAKIFRVEL